MFVIRLLIVAGAWLALAGNASAEPGQLIFDSCLANTAMQGCVDLPADPIDDPYSLAASPDGRSLYVVGEASDSIAQFSRDPVTGRTTFEGCLNNTGTQGCAALPLPALDGAIGVAVSPDGRSVYVASLLSDSISHFIRDTATGDLAWGGCLANTASAGCTELPGDPINDALAVAVSPDSKSLYVASHDGASISYFFATGPQGQPSWGGCLGSTASGGCVDLPGEPLDAATGVAVSPDGKSVYVAASGSGAIAHFLRSGPQGQIAWDSCLADLPSDGCIDLPGNPLGANGVAVSPEGRSVYVSSAAHGSIAHLLRSSVTGALAYDGCLGGAASDDCVEVAGQPLLGGAGVAVSPDGGSVYVASESANSIAHVARDTATGRLAWERCLASTASRGCVDLPGEPLDGAIGVAMSPDGESVYVTSGGSDSIAHFFHEPPVEEPASPPVSPSDADNLAPVISRLTLTNRRFRVGRATARSARRARVGTTFRYTLSEPASVRVAFERALRGRQAGGRWVSVGRTLTRAGRAGRNRLRFSGRIGHRKLRPGAYRARFTASDRSGNRSRPATIRFRIVWATARDR